MRLRWKRFHRRGISVNVRTSGEAEPSLDARRFSEHCGDTVRREALRQHFSDYLLDHACETALESFVALSHDSDALVDLRKCARVYRTALAGHDIQYFSALLCFCTRSAL